VFQLAQSARAVARKLGSPELPIAISTLRMKRLRPMRLMGLPENSARKAASSSAAKSASFGEVSSARGAKAGS